MLGVLCLIGLAVICITVMFVSVMFFENKKDK